MTLEIIIDQKYKRIDKERNYMLNEGQALPVEVAVVKPTLIESFKNAIQPETIAQRLGIDKNTLIDVGIYGAIGFIVGFLLKKYSEYFIALVLFLVGIIVLKQFGYITIEVNAAKIHDVLGLPSVFITTQGYSAMILEWLKSNIPAAASCVIGFLIGLKVA